MAKKKTQFNNGAVYAIVVSLVILFIGLGVQGANGLTLAERFIKYAGEKYGELVHKDTIGQIDFNQVSEFEGVAQTKWTRINGVVEYIEGGDFVDEDTFLLSISNPFDTATATVAWANLEVTGASTSTMRVICGGASSATADPTYELINLTLPTSTVGVWENDMATTTSGSGFIGSGSQHKILLTSDYSYFNCIATGTPENAGYWGETTKKGVTGDTNTFSGKIKALFRKVVD